MMSPVTWQKIAEWMHVRQFLNLIRNPTIQAMVTLLASFASILAVILAKVAIDHADSQFTLNSESSDRLFNVQLKNSKELNDSLISQIQQLQKVTERQLSITDEQLGISKRSLKEQIASGRPKFTFLGASVEDTSNVGQGVFAPRILTRLQNTGQRFAINTSWRPFVTFGDYREVRGGVPDTSTVEPMKETNWYFLPKIPSNFRYNFYYVYEVTYFDDALKQTFKQSSFYHYVGLRGEYTLISCTNEEKAKLLKGINQTLKKNNEPPISNE